MKQNSPNIDKVNNHKILTEPIIDPDDDIEYKILDEILIEESARQKNRIANDIEQMGENYLSEIEEKKEANEKVKRELIPYILKFSKTKYKEKDLMSYELEDVSLIYNEIRKNKKSMVVKLFRFIFNID